jgi:glycine dehydrogenase
MTDKSKDFSHRHIGLKDSDIQNILHDLGYSNLDAFLEDLMPKSIYDLDSIKLPKPLDESSALKKLKAISKQNKVLKSFIGQGFYNCNVPNVIKRNVFENPGWYTSYTPYQPEIAQGRLEALMNYQTMVSDLTSMDISNASLLDEPTAAAEAMMMANRVSKSKSKKFFIHSSCFNQTISVMKSRAKPLNIEIIVGDEMDQTTEYFGCYYQYPNADGGINDLSDISQRIHECNGIFIVGTDLLALTLLRAPGEFDADIVIGSAQRFGVPMGFGGPHAGFMAVKDCFKRSLPGRLIGLTQDQQGRPCYRLALQTREQHIRREKATSNICTAQALLAIMSGFYAIYHGPDGLKGIAERVNNLTTKLANNLIKEGFKLKHEKFFDTIVIEVDDADQLHKLALEKKLNFRKISTSLIGISVDETTQEEDINLISEIFIGGNNSSKIIEESIPHDLVRKTLFLTHEVFNSHHSETQLLRYIRSLCDKDIALDRSMIPLGSCTMKLNSTSEMIPVGWNGFANVHPHAPVDQVQGYMKLINDLEEWLANITGYKAISLQPNAGSQGEYAGLLAIDSYHKANNDNSRNICLIPESAHGTNPASAQMVGYEVVVIDCDENGDIDMTDLKNKAEQHSKNIAAMMITYPSTHGVFEEHVKDVCELIHSCGGFIYIDGANFNAMVGMCYPGKFGGDVSHLNLHKTFCIPHGGGGPGVGPIGVVEKLSPYLPKDPLIEDEAGYAISGTNHGSASILPISWMYIAMMGLDSLRKATQVAILSTNYLAKRLSDHYKILYTGKNNLVAHECIIDVRPFKELCGIEAEDIAKRLIDYGFHAPTMSWPVAGTLMIEPTESESLEELNRFCDAMIGIREEIKAIEEGKLDKDDNPLKNAPHCVDELIKDWDHTYTKKEAFYPNSQTKHQKYWPPVGRVDNVYGDRNLVCTCPSIKDFK